MKKQSEDTPAVDRIPHVLIFPYFGQGHINPMLKLADLLCLSGFHVTFLNSELNITRLLRFNDLQSRFSSYPGTFNIKTITDGLPKHHHRSLGFLDLDHMISSLQNFVKPAFREILLSDRLNSDSTTPPISCIIADGILGFTIDVGEELGIPVISFRVVSACCYWVYFCFPQLIESGELPFDDDDLDRRIVSVPEMETFLRRRDLPSFCRAKELSDPSRKFIELETFNSTRATAQILNTFEDLEGPVLNRIRSHCPNLYTIGPLHSLLKSRSHYSSSSNCLWEVDRSCMTWLDSQPAKSVVYVSFGSVTRMSRNELFELWFGLVNSGKRFLWVRRPDSVEECREIPLELLDGTRERGYVVEWSPQEEVLVHPSIGGFLTQGGWNSTLESVVAGVPMICWPHFADQQINARFMSEVWKVGMDMKDMCYRSTVEKLVRELMEDRREELMRFTAEMARKAEKAVSDGGSSYTNFERLVALIRHLGNHNDYAD